MPETTLETTIPVTIESTWQRELCNPYVDLTSVRAIARLAGMHKSFFTRLAIFVCNIGKKKGYQRTTVGLVKNSVHALPGVGYHDAKRLATALDLLAGDYENQLAHGDMDESNRRELPNVFTAAISEAIVARFLLKSGRQQHELVADGHFRIGDRKQSASNIDITWHRINRQRADLYECKNDPQWLLKPWQNKDNQGCHREWEKSQLNLMLSVREALLTVNWGVRLCCITLRQRDAIQDSLEVFGSPSELEIYAQEDFGASFPPPI